MAGQAVRQPVELLCRAAAEIRPGRLRLLEMAVHAGMPVLLLGRPGGRHGAGGAGRRHRPGSGGNVLPVWPGRRERIGPGAPAIFGTWCLSPIFGPVPCRAAAPSRPFPPPSAQLAQFYDLTGGTALA